MGDLISMLQLRKVIHKAVAVRGKFDFFWTLS